MSATQSTDVGSNTHKSAVKDEAHLSGGSKPSATPTARPRRLHDVKTKNLSEFSNGRHLVVTMLGAMIAHQRLYEDAGYLHGDINNNTIVILKHPDGKTEGALIDYDLPINIASQRKKYNPDKPTPARQRPHYYRPRYY